MFNKTFDEITKADIDRLFTDGVREGRQLDYKAELPGRADKDKKELARDVTSFANGAGGCILFGITDVKDASGKNTGVPAAEGLPEVNADQEILRLEGMLRGNIDPVITGMRLKAIDGFPKGPVILLQIPRSWNAPHMVNVDKDSRFYARGSGGKQPMDVQEIRSAFLLSAEMPTLIRRFRDERLGRIMADETPVLLESPARVILHLIPFASMGIDARIDLEAWANDNPRPLVTVRGWSSRYNFDGYLTFNGCSDDAQWAYTQVFRTGALEAAMTFDRTPEDGQLCAYPWVTEERILQRLNEYIQIYQKRTAELPIVIALSLLGVKGSVLPRSHKRSPRNTKHQVERDTLLLPDVLVRDYAESVPQLMRPAFDALWQAFGVPKSLCYDKDGNWNGRNFDW